MTIPCCLTNRGACLAMAAVLLTLWIGAARAASPDEIRYFRIGTATSSGTYFTIGGLIANAITSPPGAQPCEHGGSCGVPGLIAVAQATSGGIENLELLRNGALEAAMIQTNLAAGAEQGSGPYAGQPPFTGLRAIATLYVETVQIVVRADSPMHNVADLRGHSISVGEKGSAIALDAETILDSLGLPPAASREVYLRPGPSVDQLVEGSLDALFIVGGAPFAAIDDAARRIPIRLIPISAGQARTIRESQPLFAVAQVPAGTYPEVPAVDTVGVGALLAVRADLEDDLVYGITRALWHPSTRRALEDGFPRGRFLALGPAHDEIPVPLHPGVARYYQEVDAAGTPADHTPGNHRKPPAAPAAPPDR
jgi:hypothetical protein